MIYCCWYHKLSPYTESMSIGLMMQVPLGVLLLDENRLDDMGKIMEHYMTLVPTLFSEGQYNLPNGCSLSFDNTRFFPVLFGGDQLTEARMRGTQALRDTQDKPFDRLEGVIPVVEDWHTRMTFLKVYLSIFILSLVFSFDCTH